MESKLKWVTDRRKLIQEEYLKLAQDTWNSDVEANKKDSRVRIAYNKYKNEDRQLERIEQMLQSTIDDIKWYKETFIK